MGKHYHPSLGIISAGQSFILGAGEEAVQYPGNWLTLSSAEEREARGVLPLAMDPAPDGRLYTDIAPAAPVISGDQAIAGWTATPRPLAEAQAALIAGVKLHAGEMIRASGHDAYAARQISTGKAMPADVVTYAEAVRAASNVYEVAVLACDTVEALACLPLPAWPS